jgi:hypothetical protein
MRKKLIALGASALVATLGMAGHASAAVFADNGIATVSPTNATVERVRAGGTGHQLIVPYFNTQNGNATLLNIVNTDLVNAKAVKIRFRGGSNSDDIFDFQLYMSPGDVWTANVSKGADGVATLSTTDKSCTLPAGVGSGGGSSFVTARLPQTLSGDALASQTREGYIEIFNMADIPPAQPNPGGSVSGAANPLFTAVKHVAGVAPCTVGVMNALSNDPATLDAAYGLGFRAPTSGLLANWTIINLPKSGAASGEATALVAALANNQPARGNIVFFPQTGAAATTIDRFTSDPSLRTVAGFAAGQVSNGAGAPFAGALPIVQASQFDLPDLSTPYLLLAGGYPPATTDPFVFVDALQNSLATLSITNEYITDPGIVAFTDWTFSQPTRRYAVAPDYRPLTASPAGPMLRAFTAMNSYYSAASTAVSGFQICANTNGVTFFDREEFTAVGNNFVISPNPPAAGFRLCGETSVLTFNSSGASVLGAEIARTNFATGNVKDGWASVATPGAFGLGLPILGKSYARASNAAAEAGLTSNFGASWEHRYVPSFP